MLKSIQTVALPVRKDQYEGLPDLALWQLLDTLAARAWRDGVGRVQFDISQTLIERERTDSHVAITGDTHEYQGFVQHYAVL